MGTAAAVKAAPAPDAVADAIPEKPMTLASAPSRATESTAPEPSVAPQAAAAEPIASGAKSANEDPRLTAIKSLAGEKGKLLAFFLEPVVGLRFENGEVSFVFARKGDANIGQMLAQEQQQTLRSICSQVLGQPVRTYATLWETDDGARAARPAARERATQDAGVERFRRTFDCALVEVKDLTEG